MNISTLSVKRPVTTFMIFLGIIILGLISWTKLPQELFPSITYPQITVFTAYKNAAPEEIETLITKVIEEAVGTVSNVKRISSISKEGMSLVMIDFNWGTNMDFAALNVREKIDLIKEKLPRESEEPIVMKYNPFDLPIMNLAVTGNIPSVELRRLCKKYIKDPIEKIEGVASASIIGGDEREISVEVDEGKLMDYQISLLSVINTLKDTNLNYPAGTIKKRFYEYLLRTMGEYKAVREIPQTPLIPDLKAKSNYQQTWSSHLIYIKDVAQTLDTIKERTSISRYNGNPSISLVITKQSGINTIKVADRIKSKIKELLKTKLPPGIKIRITYDQSQFIRNAIKNLRNAAIQGAALAFLVLLLFLRHLSSSLVITASIPISIMATLCLMYFSKININMMSLGGLALGIGMLVDNSIVVIENIYRHRRQGKPLIRASIDGASEMTNAIFGSTLTTIAVFMPFAFVSGIAGQIFKQLSLTITFSLLASVIVSVSLIPMLTSLGSRKYAPLPRAGRKKTSWEKHYSYFIAKIMNYRLALILAAGLAFFSAFKAISRQERCFLPKIDQRQFLIKVDLPPKSRLQLTNNVVKRIENILLGLRDIKDVTVNIGSNKEKIGERSSLQTLGVHQAQIMVNLKKNTKQNKYRSTEEVIRYIKNRLNKQALEGATIEYISQESSLNMALKNNAPLAIEIRGHNMHKLAELSRIIQDKISRIKGVYGVKSTLTPPSPETRINIIKDKVSQYGLSVRDVSIVAHAALKGYVATKFKNENGDIIDVRVRLRPQDRNNTASLRRLLIYTPSGINIPLSDVAYLTQGTGPTEIRRVDQQREVLVTANILGRAFGEVLKDANAVIGSLKHKIPLNFTVEITGEKKNIAESFHSMVFALSLALLLVYMIMAAEFESLWQPFLIMFTVPLSLIGVTIILKTTKTPLSIIVYLGIIMLGGIVVNNGIVLIDYINRLRRQGYSPYDAVVEASTARLRPILMTSLTTVLGLLPLALGLGEGAELRAPLALTVIGGIISATFLTLVVLPALYLTATGLSIRRQETEPETGGISFIPDPETSGKTVRYKEDMPEEGTKPEEEGRKEERRTTPSQNITPPPEINQELPDGANTQGLNPRQIELIKKLRTLKKITRKEYADMFSVSIPTAARDLKELLKRGILKAKGPLGPGRWYELA